MIKSLIIIVVIMGIGAVGGFMVGTKHPTVGDCVNSVIRS